MAAYAFLFLTFLLIMINHSSASYCVCNQGVNDTVLQKSIDYACGTKADCSAILQGGSCYQPNTMKAHCDYAVNYYYQKMNQVTGSCSFSGTASVTSILTSTLVSGCTYPASPSGVSSSTPSSSTPSSSTPSSSTPSSSTPSSSAMTPTTTPTGSTSSTTSPTTSMTGSTSFPIAPAGSFTSRGCRIHVEVISVTLIILFLTGFLALWC